MSSSPATLSLDRTRAIAVLSIFLTPILLPAIVGLRHGAACAQGGEESLALLIPFALLLASTANPWRAVAACLAYLPVGYALMIEPCSPVRSQGTGGLLHVLWPVLAAWVAVGAWMGGAILIRVFRIRAEPEPATEIPTPLNAS